MNLKRIFHTAVDFLHPSTCSCCDNGYDSAGLYCETCEKEMEHLTAAPRCPRCAMPVAYEYSPCPYCHDKGFSPLKSIAALGVFKDPIKSAIQHAKFHGRWPLLELLAKRLFEQPDVQQLLHESDVIVPIPLHRHRQVQRGYNQSEVIARWLGKKAGKPVKIPAVRARATDPQTDLTSRVQRAENLKNAFVVARPKVIEEKKIVIVDDVITTASTLLSLARTLKSASPASISAAVLAVGDPKGRAFEVI